MVKSLAETLKYIFIVKVRKIQSLFLDFLMKHCLIEFMCFIDDVAFQNKAV